MWIFIDYMVKIMIYGIEKKKVDKQGRFVLPTDWRKAELGEDNVIYVLKRKGYLKIIPKKKIDLRAFFDQVDLGVDAIGDWSEFERKFYETER